MLSDLYLWADGIQPPTHAFLHTVKCGPSGSIPPLLPVLAADPHGRHDSLLDFHYDAAIFIYAHRRDSNFYWGLDW